MPSGDYEEDKGKGMRLSSMSQPMKNMNSFTQELSIRLMNLKQIRSYYPNRMNSDLNDVADKLITEIYLEVIN